MKITKIELENFKKITKASVNVRAITVLVGGNDSGKSSFVQGLHFAVMAASAFHAAGKKTFPQERLLFCPTLPFVRLGNKGEYANQSNFLKLRIDVDEDGKQASQEMKIYRARNDNVGFEYEKSTAEITRLIQSRDKLFTVYVPGVSGIGRSEPLHQKGQIKRGIASGDANLYLRSVLHCIKKEGKLEQLKSYVKSVFPDFYIDCKFDEENDAEVRVDVSTAPGGIPTVPLELAATGVLQILQLFSYVTLFEPRLLLLDEPDAHIHPDRQHTLARALVLLTQQLDVQIILTTHSKHLISSLQSEAEFYAFSGGACHHLKDDQAWASLLTDLGIVSQLEHLNGGTIKYLVLTEDTKSIHLQTFLLSNGIKRSESLMSSYGSSSQLHSAVILAQWVNQRFPSCKVIVHRDRDFLSDDEVEGLRAKYSDAPVYWLITNGSDIESYFCEPEVLAAITGRSVEDCANLVEETAKEIHNELVEKYTNKRNESKNILKATKVTNEKVAEPKLATSIPLPKEQRLGKRMLAAITSKLGADQKKMAFKLPIEVSQLKCDLFAAAVKSS